MLLSFACSLKLKRFLQELSMPHLSCHLAHIKSSFSAWRKQYPTVDAGSRYRGSWVVIAEPLKQGVRPGQWGHTMMSVSRRLTQQKKPRKRGWNWGCYRGSQFWSESSFFPLCHRHWTQIQPLIPSRKETGICMARRSPGSADGQSDAGTTVGRDTEASRHTLDTI